MVGGILAFLFMHSVRKLILNTEDPFESARKWGSLLHLSGRLCDFFSYVNQRIEAPGC